MLKIGLFDSGVGGRSFIEPLNLRFPKAEIIYREDKDNIPYGSKSPEELLKLTSPIFHEIESAGCEAILVACNTVTTNIISELRSVVGIPLIGVEPMIKTAAEQTSTKSIVVCATPATLASRRYSYLKNTYGGNLEIFEPDCSKWSSMIEQNRQNELELYQLVDSAKSLNADVMVLGCTHYHWIQEELQELCGDKIAVIQPIEPVLDQLERVLKKL